MDRSDATGIASVIIGAGIAMSALVVPWEIPLFVRHVLFWIGVLVVMVGVVWLLNIHAMDQQRTSVRRTIYGLIFSLLALTITIIEWPNWGRESSSNDLMVNFRFPDAQQIGTKSLHIDFLQNGSANKSVIVAETGIIEIFLPEPRWEPSATSVCVNAGILDADLLASMGKYIRSMPAVISEDHSFTDGVAFVFRQPVNVKTPMTIGPMGSFVIPTIFDSTVTYDTKHIKAIVVCPMVRILDSSGNQIKAICRGAEVSLATASGLHSTLGISASVPVARLLPKPDRASCQFTYVGN